MRRCSLVCFASPSPTASDAVGASGGASAVVDCAHYVEQFFPAALRQSSLAQVPLDVAVGLDVRGPGGGQWSFRWVSGVLHSVEAGLHDGTDVVYRLDATTFSAVVMRRLPLQEAFFARQIEIDGHVEKGLKLAVLFGQFVQERPYDRSSQESVDACTFST